MAMTLPTSINGRLRGLAPDSPLAALNAFYHAFNSRDLAAMERQWANHADASMSNPLGGIARGWPAIRALYQRLFDGPARVQVAVHDYTLHDVTPHHGRRHGNAAAHADFFYAVGRERGALERGDTRLGLIRLELAIRTSRLYRHIDGAWRQVHHHGSFEDPALLAAYREAVQP